MKKYVESIISNLETFKSRKVISRNDILKILIDTRHLIESENLKKNYPLLNLFMNWFLHPKITESQVAYDWLLEISKKISEASQQMPTAKEAKETTKAFIYTAENVMSIPAIRREFISLYKAFEIPGFLFKNKQNWDTFVIILIEEITEKPLTFPEEVLASSGNKRILGRHKAASLVLQKIQQINPNKPWAQVVEIRIVKDREGFPNLYCIEFMTRHKVRYVVQLKGREPDKAFES